MLVSEIDTDIIADYLRLENGEYDDGMLEWILDASKSYVRSYTGLDDAAIDGHADIATAVLVLCQDMYDNRTRYIDTGNVKGNVKDNMNRTVESILDMHRVNLL